MDLIYLPAEEITCWLPFASSPFYVEDYFGNRQLYPTMTPLKNEYQLLDLAIIRAQLRRMLQEKVVEGSTKDTLVSLANYVTISNHGVTIESDLLRYSKDIREAVLTILDGIEPSSTQFFKRVGQSENFICNALCLEGTQIAKEPRPQKILITFLTGEKKEVFVKPNTLTWLTSIPGDEALVEYDFNDATVSGKSSGSTSIIFGEAGFVVDTRGRPFEKPEDSLVGKAQIATWLGSLHDVRLISSSK